MPLTDIGRSLTQQHAPIKGKETEIYIAVLEQGQQIAPVNQELFALAFYSVVTLSGTPSNNDVYVLVLTADSVVTTITYTATTAAGLTNTVVGNGLVALINATTAAANYRAKRLTADTFVISADITFTIADTGSTVVANITPAAVAGSTIDKGETTITLAAPLTGQINAGQFLCFADKDDLERLVEVTAKAAVGATTLTVRALDQGISGGSQAEFPPYLWDRTGADVSRSYSNQTATTFNTGGNRDGVPDTTEKNFSLPGLAYHYNAAYQTAKKAADDQNFIYLRAIYPAPNSDFQHGGITEGRGLVSAANSASSASGFRTNDLEIQLMGSVLEIPALAVA